MKFSRIFLLLAMVIALVGCVSEKAIKDAMVKDPTILTDAIKAHPKEFFDALQTAAMEAKKHAAKDAQRKQEEEMMKSIDNPLVPSITDADTIRGDKNAPLILVEYSDFQCPYCAKGYQTVMQLKEKYGKKLQFVYKHLPLSFHPHAKTASKYYEALALQSPEKAFKFHDMLYDNAKPLNSEGEKYLKQLARKTGANMGRLAKDIKSPKIEAKIKADMAEAGKFGMSGTPGFLINGVPVRGAYPASHFVKIIDKLVEKGKVKL